MRCPIGAPDLAWLQRFGVLRADVALDGDVLTRGNVECSADLADASAFEIAADHMLGTRLAGGVFMTGGFFVGPQDFYERLIAITDSRFQNDLVEQAKAQGKLPALYEVPERCRRNLPHVLEATLQPWADAGLLPDFPFGTDLSDDELRIVRALKKLKHASAHPVALVQMAVKSVWQDQQAPPACLDRLGLTDAHSFKDRFIRRLFAGYL